MIDWSRTDEAGRSEDTGFSENLTHSAVRDRSLSEHVKALLDEWQVSYHNSHFSPAKDQRRALEPNRTKLLSRLDIT